MIDQIIVGIYLIATLIIGLLVGRETRNISDFAIGKRNFSTVVLLSTVFASVVDGNGTLGLAEAIFSQGPFYCVAFLGIVLSYLGLAWFIAPNFDQFLGLLSSGDILGKLYGPKAKIFMGFATIFESTMLTGIQILAMTHILQYFFSMPAHLAAFGSSVTILLYSLRGGIRAVTATDVFQFGILVIAIPLVCGIALSKIGGLDGLMIATKAAHEKVAGDIDYLKNLAVFASFALPALFPLTIQRMLMAKHTKQISATFLATGLLSLPFYLVVGVIAISALVLLPDIAPNFVFPALINEVLPVGVKGFAIAGLLAVFMSSIDSNLNVASVAVIHDIVSPLSKNNISEQSKLRIARVASVIIALLSTVFALSFNNIISMIYFLLCVSNSAFFPGYLVGLLGLRPGINGFWTGLIAAVGSVFFFTFFIGMFELYAGLISIAINVCILLVFHWKEHHLFNVKENLYIKSSLRKPSFIMHSSPLKTMNLNYCNTFAVLALINAVVPFFFLSTVVEPKNSPYLIAYVISALLAFLIIFRETWQRGAEKLFVPLWYLLLIISRPCLSLLMCLHTAFEAQWILNLVISFFLLIILTDKQMLLVTFLLGSMLAILINHLSGEIVYDHVTTLGKWSILSHMVTLAFCLFIFRKHDIMGYQFLSSKLAHEASRSLSSLSSSAEFLKLKMPELLRSYEWAHQNGYSTKAINQEVIDELKVLPLRLQGMGQRTAKTVDALLGRMYQGDNKARTLATADIFACVNDAIADPSIKAAQKSKIAIDCGHHFSFSGDQPQIAQAILNIIENALHAIATIPHGRINIWAEEHSLFIKDNGVGISKKNLPNIFDEFFTTKNTLGQGLAFCQQVMSDHGGNIYCESEENSFTQFELRFLIRSHLND